LHHFSIEETVVLIRRYRDAWMRAQAVAKPADPPERA